MSIDMDTAQDLDITAGGSFARKTLVEGRAILDSFLGNSFFPTSHNEPCQKSESIHESLSTAEPEPLTSTSQDSVIESSPEPGTMEEEEFQPPEFLYQFEDDPSENLRNISNCLDVQLGKEPSSVQIQLARNLLTEPSPRPTVPPLPPDPPNETFITEAMEKKWSIGVGNFSEALWISSPSTIISCSIRGIFIEAHLNPTMEVNIMPWHIVYTLFGNITLRPSDKLVKSCPSGHILECRGVACAASFLVDKVKVNLDFHIFDVIDLVHLLGSPVEKLLDSSRGSQDENLREASSAIIPLFSKNSMEKRLPKQNPLNEMRCVSLFTSSKPVFIEVVEFSTPQEYDSEDPLHLCEGERSSSPSTEFELLPIGPYHVDLDLARESTLILVDESM
jgi:hypothetical protein